MCFTITFGVFNVGLGLTFSKMFVVRDEDRFPGHPAFTHGHLCGHTERSFGEIVEEGHLTIILSSVLYLPLCWCVRACARTQPLNGLSRQNAFFFNWVYSQTSNYYFCHITKNHKIVLGFRVGHPQMCHSGMWIILSWKQSRPKRLRKNLWPFF